MCPTMLKILATSLVVGTVLGAGCPTNSYISGSVEDWNDVGPDDCECSYGYYQGYVKDADGYCVLDACTAYTCPSNSYMYNWPACDFSDCVCNWGYSRNETSASCSTEAAYKCPEFADALWTENEDGVYSGPSDFSDCSCFWGYTEDAETETCVEDVTEAGITCHAEFPNSYPDVDVWPPMTADDCTCLYGYIEERTVDSLTCTNPASDNVTDKFECPENSYESGPWPVTNFSGCECFYGYEEAEDGCVATAASTYICPNTSYASGPTWPPTDFTMCTCFYGYERTGSETGGHCYQEAGVTTLECPDDSYASSWPVEEYADCSCFYGHTRVETADSLVCEDGGDFECPDLSYANSWPPAENDDCTCNTGTDRTVTDGDFSCEESDKKSIAEKVALPSLSEVTAKMQASNQKKLRALKQQKGALDFQDNIRKAREVAEEAKRYAEEDSRKALKAKAEAQAALVEAQKRPEFKARMSNQLKKKELAKKKAASQKKLAPRRK